MHTIYLKDDYADLGHPDILQGLHDLHEGFAEPYGLDNISSQAKQALAKHLGADPDIHFVSGGTQANLICISALLRSHEAVIACESGHIIHHEAGAIEATGHKIIYTPGFDGKITIDAIQTILELHQDEHMVVPRIVFLSQSTEFGTIYQQKELEDLYDFCSSQGLLVYVDGARIAAALASPDADFSLADMYRYSDIFSVGGTKNGALLGEAIVIRNNACKAYFRNHIKMRGALLAKQGFIALQFLLFFRDNLFFDIAELRAQKAQKIIDYLQKKKVPFLTTPQTNQLFPIFSLDFVDKLKEEVDFYTWEEQDDAVSIRLVISWNLSDEDINRFITFCETLL